MTEGTKTLQELHAIREAMYEERKHLSPEEWAALSNRRAEEIMLKYGLKLKRATKPVGTKP